MRIENNSVLNNQYPIRLQEVRPAQSLLEAEKIKAGWEVTDQFTPSNSSAYTVVTAQAKSRLQRTNPQFGCLGKKGRFHKVDRKHF